MSSGYDDRFEDEGYDDRDRDDGRGRRRRRAPDREEIKTRVRGPAIGLLVTGIISLLASLGSIVNVITFDQQIAQVEKDWDNDPNMTPQQKKEMKAMLNDWKGPLKVILPITIGLGVTIAAVTIFGSIQMMNLSGRGMAMAGAVLSMLPISGCCCLGLPFGIWALMALAKPEVKAAFATGSSADDSDSDPDRY